MNPIKSMIKLVILVVAMAVTSFAQGDANTIIERSVEANAADWRVAPDYDFVERDRQPRGGTKTYEELMILGSPYERLVALNGKPLSPQQEAGEQQKLDATADERKNEPQQERGKRIARYQKGSPGRSVADGTITKRLDFKLVGEQELGEHAVYVLEATPRPGYKPPDTKAKVLTGMEGELWIDKKQGTPAHRPNSVIILGAAWVEEFQENRTSALKCGGQGRS